MNKIVNFFAKNGIHIKNEKLYELAFTHPSYNADARTKHQDYERLEYMGDAVLGFVAADLIYKHHPSMDQGLMSKLRSNIVKSSSLASYARSVNFAEYIKTGNSIQPRQINESNKILEDVFEAVIGALYLDQGIDIAYQYIKAFILEDIMKVNANELTDAKTRLQEEMQAEHQDRVTYVVTNMEGPAHDRTFYVDVVFNDVVLASGKGKSKKEAEENAARKALEKRRV